MENNIKEIIDAIEVPLNKLDAAIVNGVKQRKKKPRYVMKIVIACAAASALLLGSGFISPKMADVLANVPIIGPIFTIEEDHKGLQVALHDPNKVALNKTVTSAGIPITFEEIVYDGDAIHVLFHMEKYEDIWPLTVLVDGEVVNNAESLAELEADSGFRGLWRIRTEEKLPDAFDLTLKIHHINGVTGDWQIETPIQKVKTDAQQFDINYKGELANVPYEIQSVKKSKTSTVVEVTHGLHFEEAMLQSKFLSAVILDDAGIPLQLNNIEMDDTEDAITYQFFVEPTASNTLEVVLYNQEILANIEPKIAPIADTFPQHLSLGEMGAFTILHSQTSGTETTLTLELDSEVVIDYSLYIDVINEDGDSLLTKFLQPIAPNMYELTYQNNAGIANIQTYDLPKFPSAIINVPLQ